MLDDFPLAVALWGDPEVTKYHGGQWSPKQISDRFDLEIATHKQHKVQYWPIFLKDTSEHVGCCGLQPRDETNGVWELGCHLRRSHWSKSLGREAAEAVIVHSFNVLGVRSIIAGHHPANLASQRFLQHLGFRYTRDEFYPPTQLMEPCYILTP
jgi:ribosomal-protein-alanine N-acetyltransferase